MSFLHRLRPVHAVLLFLGCTALAAPLLANLDQGSSVVAARRAFVSSERPIDRILKGDALGWHRIGADTGGARVKSPRLVQPPRLSALRPDPTPDLSVARMSISTAPPPNAVQTRTMPERAVPSPFPRRKPRRTVQAERMHRASPSPAPPKEATAAASARNIPPSTSDTSTPRTAPRPRIALIVTAVGLHEPTSRQAIESLPQGVTLAFAPIGERTEALAKSAIENGHTILVEVPMEPVNPDRDPGEPLTLRVTNTRAANIARLDKALSRFPDASGISSYLGARFSRSEEAASPVVEEIAARGLFLFENQPSGRSRLGALARSHNAAYAAGSLALDADRSETGMTDRLAILEKQARLNGVAIGVATAYRESIATLERWVGAAMDRGIVFVPITRIRDAG